MEKDLYEGHIAIPNLPLELTNGILAELKSIGIFLFVILVVLILWYYSKDEK